MAKIYLPSEYVNNSCKVINNGYIRVYTNDNYTNYVDIYLNQDYQVKEGSTNYSQTPNCDVLNEYTDDFYYRTDLDKIMIIFLVMVIFTIWLPIKIVSKLFKKGMLL